jgi:hypothetical protein
MLVAWRRSAAARPPAASAAPGPCSRSSARAPATPASSAPATPPTPSSAPSSWAARWPRPPAIPAATPDPAPAFRPPCCTVGAPLGPSAGRPRATMLGKRCPARATHSHGRGTMQRGPTPSRSRAFCTVITTPTLGTRRRRPRVGLRRVRGLRSGRIACCAMQHDASAGTRQGPTCGVLGRPGLGPAAPPAYPASLRDASRTDGSVSVPKHASAARARQQMHVWTPDVELSAARGCARRGARCHLLTSISAPRSQRAAPGQDDHRNMGGPATGGRA